MGIFYASNLIILATHKTLQTDCGQINLALCCLTSHSAGGITYAPGNISIRNI